MSSIPPPVGINLTIPVRRGRRPPVAHPVRERAYVRPVVLQAARELFRQTPSAQITEERIAARAGITRYSLGKHFASKEEIFRKSRSGLLADLSDLVRDDISTELDAFGGLYRFLQICCQVFSDRANRDLRFSLAHEQKAHPWLAEAYHRQIINPLIMLGENFLLYKSAREGVASGTVRLVAEQMIMIATAVADAHLSSLDAADFSGRCVEKHFEIAARSYAGLFQAIDDMHFDGAMHGKVVNAAPDTRDQAVESRL